MDKSVKYIGYGLLAAAVVGVTAFFLTKAIKKGVDKRKREDINIIRG